MNRSRAAQSNESLSINEVEQQSSNALLLPSIDSVAERQSEEQVSWDRTRSDDDRTM